jgi:hypothetical protein
MNGYIICAHYNRPTEKGDATGAFIPGAHLFREVHGLPRPYYFNNHNEHARDAAIRKEVMDAINSPDSGSGWETFAYFGHGGSDALWSARIHGQDQAADLAKAIAAKAAPGIIVMLYACDAGAPNGFASWLADGLAGVNGTVYGHLPPPGHSFTNPNVVSYPGGDPVVSRTDKYKWSNWCELMRDERSPFWASFPFMSDTLLDEALRVPAHQWGRWRIHGPSAVWDNVFWDSDENIVYRTNAAPKDRYQIVDQGTWYIDWPDMVVGWSDGSLDRWRLTLTPKHQNVWVEKDGKRLHCHAQRVEGPQNNTPAMFHQMAGAP